jgi:hypothetical protein
MALNTSLRRVASRMMAKFGGDITLRRVTPGVYNPDTGAISEALTSIAIKGVLENVTRREVNDLIQAGDKRLIIAAADVGSTIPTTDDRVAANGRTLQVIEVRTIEQDSLPITYELILRD